MARSSRDDRRTGVRTCQRPKDKELKEEDKTLKGHLLGWTLQIVRTGRAEGVGKGLEVKALAEGETRHQAVPHFPKNSTCHRLKLQGLSCPVYG